MAKVSSRIPTVARHDPTIARMPIFTVQPRGPKSADAWETNAGRFTQTDWFPLHKDEGDAPDHDIEIRLFHPVWLGEMHESVLLGAMSLAGRVPSADRRFIDPPATMTRTLFKEVIPNWERCDRICITTTPRGLIEASGLASAGTSHRALPDVLTDLNLISHVYRNSESETATGDNFFKFALKRSGELELSLSERLSRLFYPPESGRRARFVSVDMAERAKLRGDMARLLHRYLSVVVWEGEKRRPFYPDTLLAQLYREPTADPKIRYLRRNGLTKALEQIAALDGWDISLDSGRKDVKVLVTRHRTGLLEVMEEAVGKGEK